MAAIDSDIHILTTKICGHYYGLVFRHNQSAEAIAAAIRWKLPAVDLHDVIARILDTHKEEEE